ncbi:MAG: beta-propeller fold lactonase family protein [Verrucomicrobiota bacterium]
MGAPPLIAYVGTFSSPLHDVLPTQVDLPPGNGRGIHLFEVDRATGALTHTSVFEAGTSPSCLVSNAAATHLYSANETDRVGGGKEGSVSAYAIQRKSGQLTRLNTVRSGGAGPTYVSIHPSGRFLLVANYWRLGRRSTHFGRRAAWGTSQTSNWTVARSVHEKRPTLRPAALPSVATIGPTRT